MDKPPAVSSPPLASRILPAGLALPQIGPGVQPMVLAQITELTGTGAVAGGAWRDGVEMAVVEINAQGGVLGRPLQLLTYDSQSTPAGARASAQRALDAGPLALLGPMSSLTAIAVAPMARNRRVCLITGAESGLLLAQANPQVVLTGPGQTLRLGKLARWAQAELRARRIALLWSNTEVLRDIRNAFLQAARKAGLEIAADVAAVPGQPAGAFAAGLATDVGRVVRSAPDAVFLAASQEQAARMLIELHARAPALPVFGEATLLNVQTLDAAGPAAVGLRAHVPLTADAPLSSLEAFHQRFNTRFKAAPGAAAIKGYIAVAMVKAAVEKLGRVDPHAIAETLRGRSFAARDQPGLLLDTAWTDTGEADRLTFMAELREDRSLAWSVLPAMQG